MGESNTNTSVAPELIDHSRIDDAPVPKLDSASNLILIDNYDSFTWNVYQYLVLEGASVTVFRNDKISLSDLIAKNPTQLVISPGPGHPDTDAGISREAIEYFSGKIPIFGVCMGQQCIISYFGGKVDVTGEIRHGKTSPLRHDNKGVYAGLMQNLPVTRYHSLAGTHLTLPFCLEVSSYVAAGVDGSKEVIMGVRHKEYVIEGVQFHPESILTEEGRKMFRNFLKMTGGRWDEIKVSSTIPQTGQNGTSGHPQKQPSRLEEIYARRREDVRTLKLIPSTRPEDLQASYALGLAPPQISFPDRLRRSDYPTSLMAEIKRASPSKGDIQLSACAPAQARKYAEAGASVISVLTEPHWFKGSLEDLRIVRQSLEGMPNRPAILRKEFVFEEYQILEARLAGADTILLIVKMLDVQLLTRLYRYSQSLGMEPLVEVNTAEEMKIAVELGSQVIGVNNRDLTTFDVDMGTTGRLMEGVPQSTIVCALSGISNPADVKSFAQVGAKAVLVGEALMRAENTVAFISDLLGKPDSLPLGPPASVAVKICGTRTAEAAKVAVQHGADLIGIIRVPGRSRFVSDEDVLKISRVVKETPKPGKAVSIAHSQTAQDYFKFSSQSLVREDRAQLVGVFLNASLETINNEVRKFGLDVVQLHGSEPLEWARNISVPVIRRFAPNEIGLNTRAYHAVPLLDAGVGGSGQKVDASAIRTMFDSDPSIRTFLAGGLTPDNVGDVLANLGPASSNIVGVDVSSGVESDGKQDHDKIVAFIKAAKATDK